MSLWPLSGHPPSQRELPRVTALPRILGGTPRKGALQVRETGLRVFAGRELERAQQGRRNKSDTPRFLIACLFFTIVVSINPNKETGMNFPLVVQMRTVQSRELASTSGALRLTPVAAGICPRVSIALPHETRSLCVGPRMVPFET